MIMPVKGNKTPAAEKTAADKEAPKKAAAKTAKAAGKKTAAKTSASKTAAKTSAAKTAAKAASAKKTTTKKTSASGKAPRKKAPVVSTYEQRFDALYDEMKYLYAELYHNDMHAFDYFCGMLKEYYKKRPARLRDLDQQRLAEGDWFRQRKNLGVQLYVDCFAGNLKGTLDKIDYISKSGVNYLHLMPLLKSPKGASDGGYSVSDYRRVQPELGTLKDLTALTDRCHEKGIAVCTDFVMNHTSDQHEWAMRAKKGEEDFINHYYFYDDWNIPNLYDRTVPEVFPKTAPGNFTWCEELGKVVMTMFNSYQWDLNYSNPTVFNDMVANMLYLANKGIDIIRLDAVPYIWKTLGTNCRNLPQVHNICRLFHIAAEIVAPGVLLLGEVVMEPDKVVPYFGSVEKPECQMLYNVTTMATTWHTVATRDVRLMQHQLETVFSLPHDFTFLNYLRCHDDIGWGLDYDYLKQFLIDQVTHKKFLNDYFTGKWGGSPARGELYNDAPELGDARLCGTTASLCGIEAAEEEHNEQMLHWSEDLDIMLHAFLMTLSGIPIIYSGDEIGMTNDYSYHDDPMKRDDSRYVHRGKFDWEAAAKRNDPSTRPGRIYTAIQKLHKVRTDHAAFDFDADTWLLETENEHVLGIGRFSNEEKLLALFNFSDVDEASTIPDDEEYTDAFTGEKIYGNQMILKSHEFRWLLKDFTK